MVNAAAFIAYVDAVVDKAQPRQVILFGSYAYGRPLPDSDIDLLVVVHPGRPGVGRRSTFAWSAPRDFGLDLLVVQ